MSQILGPPFKQNLGGSPVEIDAWLTGDMHKMKRRALVIGRFSFFSRLVVFQHENKCAFFLSQLQSDESTVFLIVWNHRYPSFPVVSCGKAVARVSRVKWRSTNKMIFWGEWEEVRIVSSCQTILRWEHFFTDPPPQSPFNLYVMNSLELGWNPTNIRVLLQDFDLLEEMRPLTYL